VLLVVGVDDRAQGFAFGEGVFVELARKFRGGRGRLVRRRRFLGRGGLVARRTVAGFGGLRTGGGRGDDDRGRKRLQLLEGVEELLLVRGPVLFDLADLVRELGDLFLGRWWPSEISGAGT
jgi:hypothetical protein